MTNCRKWWPLWAGLASILVSGCEMLQVPDKIDPPPMAKKPSGDIFDPNEGTVEGFKLNATNDPKRPDSFRAARVAVGKSGEVVLFVQGVEAVPTPPKPKPTPTLKPGQPTPKPQPAKAAASGITGKADPVRVAGIIMPAPGRPGYGEAINSLQRWGSGPLDLEQDKIYPYDLSKRSRVQVKFRGSGKDNKGTLYNLNRMMIRAGMAVVDLNAATSFDTATWFKDEQRAREQHKGLWNNPAFVLSRRSPIPVKRRGAKPGARLTAPLKNGKGGSKGKKIKTIPVAPGSMTTPKPPA